jgi:hypothetical protein
MTAALEGREWSAARRGRTLPPGKTRYPFYRRLGGPQGRSGRRKISSLPGFFLLFSFVYMDSFDIAEQVTLLTRIACSHKHVAWWSARRRYGYVWLVGAGDWVLVCSLGSALLATLTALPTSGAWAPPHVVCHSYIPVPSASEDTAVMNHLYRIIQGIRSRTVQPVVSRYTDWATRPTS